MEQEIEMLLNEKLEYYVDYEDYFWSEYDEIMDMPLNFKFNLIKHIYCSSQISDDEIGDHLEGITDKYNVPTEIDNIKNNVTPDKKGMVKVYRGVNDLNLKENGRSWTTSLDVAKRFAYETLDENYEFVGGYVIESKVNIKDIVFFNKWYINDTEDEVFIKQSVVDKMIITKHTSTLN